MANPLEMGLSIEEQLDLSEMMGSLGVPVPDFVPWTKDIQIEARDQIFRNESHLYQITKRELESVNQEKAQIEQRLATVEANLKQTQEEVSKLKVQLQQEKDLSRKKDARLLRLKTFMGEMKKAVDNVGNARERDPNETSFLEKRLENFCSETQNQIDTHRQNQMALKSALDKYKEKLNKILERLKNSRSSVATPATASSSLSPPPPQPTATTSASASSNIKSPEKSIEEKTKTAPVHGVDLEKSDRGNHCLCRERGFMTPSKLRSHIAYHTLEKKFKCEICGQMFVGMTYLQRHEIRSHRIKKRKSRKTSPKVPPVKWGLGKILEKKKISKSTAAPVAEIQSKKPESENHVFLGESSDKNNPGWKCSCGSSYADGNGLRAHIKAMKFGRVFICEICPQASFYVFRKFKAHMNKIHKIQLQENYGCRDCGHTCESMEQLRIHRAEKHPNPSQN